MSHANSPARLLHEVDAARAAYDANRFAPNAWTVSVAWAAYVRASGLPPPIGELPEAAPKQR